MPKCPLNGPTVGITAVSYTHLDVYKRQVLIFATSMNIWAKVVSYPVPQTEPLSSDYTVEVNGITIPVYTDSTQHHDKKYSIAYFDFSGTVTITCLLYTSPVPAVIVQSDAVVRIAHEDIVNHHTAAAHHVNAVTPTLATERCV